MSEDQRVGTYVHKVKCIECGLHFTVYSWKEDWEPQFCPECGSSRHFLRWRESTDMQIFEFVPGHAELVAMG